MGCFRGCICFIGKIVVKITKDCTKKKDFGLLGGIIDMEEMNLWGNVPGMYEEIPKITAFIPDNKKSDIAIVILPGGGYTMRSEHEGKGYAEFLNKNGITAFVVDYRVSPYRFPLPLLDARRAIQFVRHFATKYGINKNRVLIMGSSAGGHLAALTSTYFEEIDDFEINDEISKENFIPDGQVLCYPVINLWGKKGDVHIGSGMNLLGDKYAELSYSLTPANITSESTPPAFIWHTFEDEAVNVKNSLDYAKSLKDSGVSVEMHIYPHGQHGLGIPYDDSEINRHVLQWSASLIKWLNYMNYFNQRYKRVDLEYENKMDK